MDKRRNSVSEGRRGLRRGAADARAPEYSPVDEAASHSGGPFHPARTRAGRAERPCRCRHCDGRRRGAAVVQPGCRSPPASRDDGNPALRVERVRRVPRAGYANPPASGRAAPLAGAPGGGGRRRRIFLPGTRGPEGRWISVSSRPLMDGNGRIKGSVTSVRDITARKQQLERHHLLSSIVEETADAVLVTDSLGHIVYVNAAFERTTGFSRSEVLGENPRMLQIRDALAQLLRGPVDEAASRRSVPGGRSSTAGRAGRSTCRARPSLHYALLTARFPT